MQHYLVCGKQEGAIRHSCSRFVVLSLVFVTLLDSFIDTVSEATSLDSECLRISIDVRKTEKQCYDSAYSPSQLDKEAGIGSEHDTHPSPREHSPHCPR
jgi:hypothetical protein